MKRLNIAFLASHGGSNMQAIINSINQGKLDANPVVVISNNSNSKALQRARDENIAHFHLSEKTYSAPDELDTKIVNILKKYQVDLVILAGYMKKIGQNTLKTFQNRILNIHPALLPKYGGKGMYGMRVHEAVLKSGDTQSGVTVHLIDDQYDNGPILNQEKVDVFNTDTVETLAARVLKCEHRLYAKTIGKIVSGEIVLPVRKFPE